MFWTVSAPRPGSRSCCGSVDELGVLCAGGVGIAAKRWADALIKDIVKRLVKLIVPDYGIYRIYAITPDDALRGNSIDGGDWQIVAIEQNRLVASDDAIIRDQAWYGGDGSRLYGCVEDGRIVGVCCFWFGERYRQRNFWPLQAGEAKLVQVITVPEGRNRGIARTLIAGAVRDMVNSGYQRLFARIWHSNVPSIRTFEKAGWHHIATVVEWVTRFSKRRFRITFDVRRQPSK